MKTGARPDLDAYTARERTLTMKSANRWALILAGPPALLSLVVFRLMHALPERHFFLWLALSCTVFYAAGALVHELTHYLVWLPACRGGRASLRIGFDRKSLNPYCHCAEALTLARYRLGLLAPLVVTGLIPWAVSLATGCFPLAMTSALLIAGAGGDLAVLALLRHETGASYVLDHDTRVGCTVFEAPDTPDL